VFDGPLSGSVCEEGKGERVAARRQTADNDHHRGSGFCPVGARRQGKPRPRPRSLPRKKAADAKPNDHQSGSTKTEKPAPTRQTPRQQDTARPGASAVRIIKAASS